jgi:hypothetical protein
MEEEKNRRGGWMKWCEVQIGGIEMAAREE